MDTGASAPLPFILSKGRLVMAHSSSQSGKTVIQYDSEEDLTQGVETSLLIYSNTTREHYLLDNIIATGQADAEYRVLLNAVTILKYRTSEQDRTLNLTFPCGLLITPSDSIEIKVSNCWSEPADFNASFIMHRSS